MKRTILLWSVLLSGCAARPSAMPLAARPDPAGIETTVLLIGDAGAPTARDPVMRALAREIGPDSASTTVVFVGDNIYTSGLPDIDAKTRPDAERRMNALVTAASAARTVFFIPGNHDWAWGQADGWLAIQRQSEYLATHGKARLLPVGGCPGPDVVDLGPHVRLILLDTQWWLVEGQRMGPGRTCRTADPDTFEIEIARAIRSAEGRHVVVAGHHPLRSSGPHGGKFGWQDHIFPLRALADWAWIPLPVIGSLYPLGRMAGISPQDHSSTAYESLRAALERAFAPVAPLVYVAGHEHVLEVHSGPGARFTLVSGAGSTGKISRLYPGDEALFAAARNGFMRVDAYLDGRVYLTVITVDEMGDATDSFGQWLR